MYSCTQSRWPAIRTVFSSCSSSGSENSTGGGGNRPASVLPTHRGGAPHHGAQVQPVQEVAGEVPLEVEEEEDPPPAAQAPPDAAALQVEGAAPESAIGIVRYGARDGVLAFPRGPRLTLRLVALGTDRRY